MTENWNLVRRTESLLPPVIFFCSEVGSKAGSKALMGGLLSKLKAGALAESRGEENPGMVKMAVEQPAKLSKVETVKKPPSLALGVTEGETAPDWSAWEAS